jgi:hypothetical protein
MLEYRSIRSVLQSLVVNERILLDLLAESLGEGSRHHERLVRVLGKLASLETERDVLSLVDKARTHLNDEFLEIRRGLFQKLGTSAQTVVSILADNQRRLLETLETERDVLSLTTPEDDAWFHRCLEKIKERMTQQGLAGSNGSGSAEIQPDTM